MKKSPFSLAILALAAAAGGAAQAQSNAQVYGLLDVGVGAVVRAFDRQVGVAQRFGQPVR